VFSSRISLRQPAVTLIAAVAIATAACSAPAAGGSSAGATVPSATAAAPAATPGTVVTGGTAANDPCQLVSDAAAAKLLGGTPTRTGPAEAARGVNCTWDVKGGANLLVSVWQGAEFYSPDYTNPGWKPVDGLGDKSFEDSLTQTVGFIKGATVVILFVPALETVPMGDLEDLARTAADSL
jgi:hypothetical protein